MSTSYFFGDTLDDAMRLAFEEILENGVDVVASKGRNRERNGVLLEIANPRARLSATESRSRPISCLGELCWYLAGSDKVDFISYYLKHYKVHNKQDHISGAYGPRLFAWRGFNQVQNVRSLLRAKQHTRQAVIQLFDAGDLLAVGEDVPCTCTLQFLVRSGTLHMVVHMRSNDAYIGLPHDVFCFTMLQEIIATEFAFQVGSYKHMVGSLHIYDKDIAAVKRFLDEGWQSTQDAMPPMPDGDPWPMIGILLDAEREIRTTSTYDGGKIDVLDSYWADFIRLLMAFKCNKDRNFEAHTAIRSQMSSSLFFPYFDRSTSKKHQ